MEAVPNGLRENGNFFNQVKYLAKRHWSLMACWSVQRGTWVIDWLIDCVRLNIYAVFYWWWSLVSHWRTAIKYAQGLGWVLSRMNKISIYKVVRRKSKSGIIYLQWHKVLSWSTAPHQTDISRQPRGRVCVTGNIELTRVPSPRPSSYSCFMDL